MTANTVTACGRWLVILLFLVTIGLPGLTMPGLIQALDDEAAPRGSTLPVTGHSERLVWTRPGSGITAL